MYTMYINESIPLPSKLPKNLQDIFDSLQRCRDEGDVAGFETFLDLADITIRQSCMGEHISKEVANQLMKRYGI